MNDIHCTQADLSMILDGVLSPDGERAARAHIAGCTLCASRFRALGTFDRALRSLPLVSVSPGFTASVMSALDPVMPASRAFRFAPWIAFQAVLLCVVLLGLGVCLAAGFITPGGSAAVNPPGGAHELFERAIAACGSAVTSWLGDFAHAGPFLIAFSAALVVIMLALLDRNYARKLIRR